MAVVQNNVLLYHYEEEFVSEGNRKTVVTYHGSLAGYELSYKAEGPFPNYYKILAKEGGSVSEITIGPGGEMKIDAGAQCCDVTLLAAVGDIASPYLEVYGQAENVTASSIVRIEAGGSLKSGKVLSGGKVNAYDGSSVINCEVNAGGYLSLYLSSVGKDITVASGGNLGVQYGSVVSNVTIAAGGSLSTLYSSSIDTMYVAKGADCSLGDGTVLTGVIALEGTPTIYGSVDAGQASMVFMLQNRTEADGAFIADYTKCAFVYGSITVAPDQARGLYSLAGNAAEFLSPMALYSQGGEYIGGLTLANAVGQGEEVYYMGFTEDYTLALVKDECSYVLVASDEKLEDYAVVKTFEKVISIYAGESTSPLLATRKASETEWGDEGYCYGGMIEAGSQLVQTPYDRVADVILPEASGVWGTGFMACNTNTLERRVIAGKNRYDDLVWGGGDASLVMLSDSADAFFADDIFTDVPDGVEATQPRLKNIFEIRAGAGDDIVDITMEHADEANWKIILRGGAGNDILWGGNNGARLLGDGDDDELVGGAGDDVLAGGAGDDTLTGLSGKNIYAFGVACGNDTVALTSDEDFRLWFDDGLTANVTYDEGSAKIALNDGGSITVTGLGTATLDGKMLFGAADGDTFAEWGFDALKELGAFDGDSSQRNFIALA